MGAAACRLVHIRSAVEPLLAQLAARQYIEASALKMEERGLEWNCKRREV